MRDGLDMAQEKSNIISLLCLTDFITIDHREREREETFHVHIAFYR